MHEIELRVDLKLSTSLEDFRQESGKRKIGMVFWQRIGETKLTPEMIHNETCIDHLLERIAAQRIYIYQRAYNDFST